jgi:hypothetical protein
MNALIYGAIAALGVFLVAVLWTVAELTKPLP